VTLSGIIIEVRLVQPENAPPPILVTLLPIVSDSSAVQPENAQSPILVTLLPIVTDLSAKQELNASSPILVTLSSIITSVMSACWKVAEPLPVRHAVVPSLVVTVSVPSVKLQPSPEKVAAVAGIASSGIAVIMNTRAISNVEILLSFIFFLQNIMF
jgi:hypothetical protein